MESTSFTISISMGQGKVREEESFFQEKPWVTRSGVLQKLMAGVSGEGFRM